MQRARAVGIGPPDGAADGHRVRLQVEVLDRPLRRVQGAGSARTRAAGRARARRRRSTRTGAWRRATRPGARRRSVCRPDGLGQFGHAVHAAGRHELPGRRRRGRRSCRRRTTSRPSGRWPSRGRRRRRTTDRLLVADLPAEDQQEDEPDRGHGGRDETRLESGTRSRDAVASRGRTPAGGTSCPARRTLDAERTRLPTCRRFGSASRARLQGRCDPGRVGQRGGTHRKCLTCIGLRSAGRSYDLHGE